MMSTQVWLFETSDLDDADGHEGGEATSGGGWGAMRAVGPRVAVPTPFSCFSARVARGGATKWTEEGGRVGRENYGRESWSDNR